MSVRAGKATTVLYQKGDASLCTLKRKLKPRTSLPSVNYLLCDVIYSANRTKKFNFINNRIIKFLKGFLASVQLSSSNPDVKCIKVLIVANELLLTYPMIRRSRERFHRALMPFRLFFLDIIRKKKIKRKMFTSLHIVKMERK